MISWPPLLYHGSYCSVDLPDISRCAGHKDFGRGFYLTSSLEQARQFAGISLRKARITNIASASQERGYVSAFRVKTVDAENLTVHRFKTANREWLRCIAAHRMLHGASSVIEKYAPLDVIIGKIANDRTNTTITAYMSGVFGPTGSAGAIDTCIGLLLPERLKEQFCFRTARALRCLEFLWSKPV